MSTATDMLSAYLEAEQLVLQRKSATLSGRTYTREDLVEIRKGRLEWQRRVWLEQRQSASDYDSARYQQANFSDE